MIILCVIIFQLMERIAIVISQIFGFRYALDMLGFSYSAIPTRHEVHIKPHLTEENTKNENTIKQP